MATKPLKKVLVLHGWASRISSKLWAAVETWTRYAQSAAILSKRMGALRKTCGKDVDFVFLDAPHVLSPVDMAETFNTTEELGAAESSPSQTDIDPALQPRGWWRPDPERKKTNGIELSLTLLRDVLSKDHYEGVFGFSQGASMAAVLAALLERPHVFPDFLIDGKPPHPPLTFCIAVAGFRPLGPFSDAIFLPKYSTPTVHVLGRTDVIVVEERAKTLIDISENARVEWHDGGHFVPSKANWRSFFRDYLRNPTGEIPSPGLNNTGSLPPSGVATPVSAQD